MSVLSPAKTEGEIDVLTPVAPGWYVLAVLSLLMGFASISTDLYLPGMPAMGRSLHAATGMVEWTISGYLIGFSSGQLLWGPISDRYGRRMAIGSGLILFVIGSAGCALASDALTGAVQYGSGIFGSGLVGLWADGTPWPLGLVVAMSGIGCLLSMLLLIPSRTKK